MELNKQRYAVKTHDNGPLIVAAVPGAGKTRCIVERIKYLLDNNVERKTILAVTFTNKAADEMKARLERDGYPIGQLTVSTFHSFCVGVLRKCGHLLGFTDNFNIYDEKDQQAQVKHVLKDLGMLKTAAALKEVPASDTDDEVKPLFDSDEIVRLIEKSKNERLTLEDIEASEGIEKKEILSEYQIALKRNNSMDFSDLISNTCELFDKFPKVAEYYSTKYKHILVDEAQDTNKAQYHLIELLMKSHKNVILVGDDDQCFPKDAKVLTENGYKQISELAVGDQVMSMCDKDSISNKSVTKVIKNKYEGILLILTLSNGLVIECTPNHLIPSNIKIADDYLIYLMEKKGLGFRIGMCKSRRKGSFKSEENRGYISRLIGEHADNLWVVDTAKTKADALLKEHRISTIYGIPMLIFHANGRNVAFNNADIKAFYESIDTIAGAEKLAVDFNLDLNNPVYRSRMSSYTKSRYTVNVILNGHRNGTHKYSLCSNNKEPLMLMDNVGNIRKGKSKTWRIERATKNLDNVTAFINEAQNKINNVYVHAAIKTKYKPFQFHPAAHLKVGSEVLAVNDTKVEKATILSIHKKQYNDFVYDINVEGTHNYIVNGMVVHNSIYGFRQACAENMLKFIKVYNPKIVKLETNYRSTPEILAVAGKLIKYNKHRIDKELKTPNPSIDGVKYFELSDNKKEAELIARIILKLRSEKGYKYSDFAILYRTNMISHEFEEICRMFNIPYKVYGGFGFYDRKEIKTFLSYMKFLANPKDVLSFNNCVNEPRRGVGDTAQLKITKESFRTGKSILELCKEPPTEGPNKLTKAQAEGLKVFAEAFDGVDIADAKTAVRKMADQSGLIEALRDSDSRKQENRADNVLELLNSFEYWASKRESPKISDYLQEVQLMSNEEEEIDDDHVRLMTIHSAKGLEFNCVFVVACEEGTMPHKRAVEESGPEEERRLAYVAFTRAKNYLYVTRAKERWSYGDMKETIPSRFLFESGLLKPKDEVKSNSS